MRRLVLAAVSLLALLSALAPVAAAATSDLPLKRGDFAGSFGISEGRSMFLECFGHGSPTVILDAGLRNGGAIWAERTAETPAGPTVLEALARETRVCAYDRPGVIIGFDPLEFSRSSPTFMPRVAAEAVYDLHRLLWNAKVPGPYVFVNHSTGGLIDRLYASTYPREVAGMVLVDALAEFIEGGKRGLDPAQMEAYEAVNDDPVEGIDYPDLESFAFRHSFAQLRAEERKAPFPDVPLSVISHGKPFGLPAGLPGGLTPEAVERAWTYSQERLAKLTPGAVQVVAKRSSHYVMLTQPKLVIEQAKRVVRAVRHQRGRRYHGAAAAANAANAGTSAATVDRFTPVAAEVLAATEPVLASDGRRHLEYELILSNHSYPPASETVRSIQALAGGKVLASLSGARLAAVTKPFDLGPDDAKKPTRVLAPGVAASVLVDLSFPPGAKLPQRIVHRISIAQQPPSKVIASRYLTAPTEVSDRQALVVAPPLRGPGWVVGNGCCAEPTSHRSGVLAVDGGLYNGERFAIDFFQIGPGGTVSVGPHDQLSNWPFFGAEVRSATAGTVVGVRDGLPDGPFSLDLPPITAADAGGNHVVVALGGGRYAFYAHLQPGSVRVEVGDRVRAGQPLGLLGNSGNSNAPHLHFQLMDGPVPLGSNGIPFTFSSFRAEGTLRNFAPLLTLGARAKLAPQPSGMRQRQLPLNNEVVGFAP